MKPYLAVIADSFRAAFASRILWLALVLVALFLLVVAPVGYHEVVVSEFSQDEFVGRERVVDSFAKALSTDESAPSETTPTSRIAEELPDSLQASIVAAVQENGELPRRAEFVDAFNELLDRESDWYDEALWAGTTRLREQRDLESRPDSELTEVQQRRRARLRLEAAMPGAFRPRPDKAIVFSYLVWDTPVELPVRRAQFHDVVNEYVLPVILRFLLGIVGVLLGILVTASVIPGMLQPGSLHLLLSKPISRPLLYLSRFVGGCAFVFLCVVPLIVGMWLIAGTRLDLWNHRLLLCIPIFMLLFAVYFSVSALVGLWWRSGIVSVAVTVVFWVGCSIVGWGAELFEGFVSDPARLTRLAVRRIDQGGPQEERIILAGRKDSDFARFNQDTDSWDLLSDSGLAGREQVDGPLFLSDTLAVATRVRNWPAGGIGGGGRTLLMLEQIDQWQPHIGPDLPSGVVEMSVTSSGGLLVLSNGALFHSTATRLREEEAKKSDAGRGGLFSGLTRFLGQGAAAFREVTPENAAFQLPLALGIAPRSDQVVVYSRGQLSRLSSEDKEQTWRIEAVGEIEGDTSKPARVAVTDSHVIVFRAEEPAIVCDLQTLAPVGEVRLPERQTVTSAVAAPSGPLVGALLANGKLARIDTKTLKIDFPSSVDQRSVESIAFEEGGLLWAAVDIDQLVASDWAAGSVEHRLDAELSTARRIQTYLVEPLHTIIPQTGKLSSETVSAIIGGSTSRSMGEGQMAEATQERLEVTRPIISCVLFIAVLLTIGCIYIRRQDF
ncbi:MAG: ABC transporter permease [Pirellulaceae bacterium]